jgi:hypothetical protein
MCDPDFDTIIKFAFHLIPNEYYDVKDHKYTPNYKRMSNMINVNTKIHTEFTNGHTKNSQLITFKDMYEDVCIDLKENYIIHVIYYRSMFDFKHSNGYENFGDKHELIRNIIIDNCGNIYTYNKFMCDAVYCKTCKYPYTCNFIKMIGINGLTMINKVKSTTVLCDMAIKILKFITFSHDTLLHIFKNKKYYAHLMNDQDIFLSKFSDIQLWVDSEHNNVSNRNFCDILQTRIYDKLIDFIKKLYLKSGNDICNKFNNNIIYKSTEKNIQEKDEIIKKQNKTIIEQAKEIDDKDIEINEKDIEIERNKEALEEHYKNLEKQREEILQLMGEKIRLSNRCLDYQNEITELKKKQ